MTVAWDNVAAKICSISTRLKLDRETLWRAIAFMEIVFPKLCDAAPQITDLCAACVWVASKVQGTPYGTSLTSVDIVIAVAAAFPDAHCKSASIRAAEVWLLRTLNWTLNLTSAYDMLVNYYEPRITSVPKHADVIAATQSIMLSLVGFLAPPCDRATFAIYKAFFAVHGHTGPRMFQDAIAAYDAVDGLPVE
jgi:hypothetical protein